MRNFQHAAQVAGGKSNGKTLASIEGTIKWFDPAKGFGFIVPTQRQEIDGDILIHRTVLAATGVQQIAEGQPVVCDAVLTPRGLTAVKFEMRGEILQPAPWVANLDVCIPLNIPPTDKVDNVASVVKWFNRTHGYGFLIAEADDARTNPNLDVFLHMETVKASGFTDLKPKDRVWADVWLRAPKGNGLMATAIRPASGKRGPVSHGSPST